MSKAIKHMIVVVFMLLCLFALCFGFFAGNACPGDLIPTVQEIVADWELVDTDNESCGPFNYYLNPDPQARYTVAYVHTCALAGGRISQYGFLDNGKLREFDVDIDGRVKEFYRSQPNLTKHLKSYLPIETAI